MPPHSAAERLAACAYWIADTLAANEAIDFSVIKALVGVSPECLIGAPDSARERVALRCLEKLVTFADADKGGAAVAPPPSKILRIDAFRSCEDLLDELARQVGSSGILDKDIILPFRQDIQNFICIKKSTLPESSLALLREVDPEIQFMVAPSSVEQNGIKKYDNHQSLCNVHHLNSNSETPRPHIASTKLQPGNLTNLVNNLEEGSFKQCPIESTVDLDKPLETDRRFYNQPQEYAINAAGVGTRASEKDPSDLDSNMSGSSTSCNATLQGNSAEPSKKSLVDQTTVAQAQPCKGKSSNPPDYNNVIKRSNDDGISYRSLKDPLHESKTLQATMTPAFDRSNDVLPTKPSESSNLPQPIATEDTMVQQLHSCKTHLNHLLHDSGQKVNQDLDGTASIQPVEKYSIHEESTLQATSVIHSVSCSDAMQEDKSETNYPSGNTAEHPANFEEQSCDKSQLEVSCADRNKHTLHDDATMLGKNKVVCGSQNVQGAPESHSNLTLYDKISEAHCLSDQNIGKSTNDIQKRGCNISVSISCQDGYRKTAKQDSNKQTIGKTVAETSHAHSSDDCISGFAAACLLSMSGKIPLYSQDQEANDSLGVSSEQDLCIKCGKDGQLLQCSSCLLSAHDTCFGSSLAFEDPGQLYCPVCICAKATEEYKKAKKTYIEARKNLAAFLGADEMLKQLEQQTRLLPRAVYSKDQLNGHNNSSKRQTTTVDGLARQGEESNRQRKKQKINVRTDACNEVVIEKASSVGNSDVAPMIDSVLQNKSNQLQDAEQDHVENTEAHEGSSSQKRCSPAGNQEVETDKDGPTHSHHQSEDCDEIEFTISSHSGKPSFGQKDQNMPLPSRKRNYAYPPKRSSNSAAPTGRRTKVCWTVEEEATLREAMKKFAPRDNGPIPWVQILEHGRNVFQRTRLPSDLRVKWRNMKNRGDC